MAPFYARGKYRCTVLEQAWDESKSGNDMLVLRVKVNAAVLDRFNDAGDPDEEPVPQSYTRTIRLTLTSNSIEMALKKLRHAGFNGSSFDDLQLVGKDVIAACDEETYENKLKERWDLALPPLTGSEGRAPLASKPGITRKLNALFGKQLRGDGTSSPRATAPATVTAGGGALDDDIPF